MVDDSINGGRRPVPDPTTLTTEQLLRAIEAEHHLTEARLEVLRERLNGIDTATELRLGGIVDIPNQIDEKVGHSTALAAERFASIAQQFGERDTRSERESRDNKVAVDAAFAAQKEAAAKQDEGNQKSIDKSEASTAEKIAKLSELFTTTVNALSDKIDDLKERVSRIESIKAGAAESRTGLYAAAGAVGALVVALVAVIGFLLTGTP